MALGIVRHDDEQNNQVSDPLQYPGTYSDGGGK